MNMLNERVEHITFGSGVVKEKNDTNISVEFEDNIGTKKFVYPDAFDKFLKAVDPIVENNVMEEWNKKREKIEMELESQRKERIAAELEEKEAKLALANKKPVRKIAKKKINN